jgi:TolB protein
MRRTILVFSTIAVGLLVASGVALLAPSDPASATFPGQNGRIAFQSSRVTQDNPEGDYEIFKMNPDGSDIKQLTSNSSIDSTPSYSPNGKKITFERSVGGSTDPYAEIYVMNSDGSGTPRNLTKHPAYDADTAVSPDGQIAFVSDRDGNFEIYTMNADGSNPTRLTDDLGIDGESDWQSR